MNVRTLFTTTATCATTREQIEAYVLDDLLPRRAERIHRHLEHCSECRAIVRDRREFFALIPQSLDPINPPPEVLEGLLARVRKPDRRPWTLGAGMAVSAAAAALLVLVLQPLAASSFAQKLRSPDVAVINLFASLDAPISARYEYRTASHVQFDRSVGRILFNTRSGEWELVVHGLPRPPRGSRYVLSTWEGRDEHELGTIERWEDGVATLAGDSGRDLTQMDRLSLELVSATSRLRLLDAVPGAW